VIFTNAGKGLTPKSAENTESHRVILIFSAILGEFGAFRRKMFFKNAQAHSAQWSVKSHPMLLAPA
jgi:hypothetical protein